MGHGCVGIAVRAHGRQTGRQIRGQHPWERTSWQRVAVAFDSIFRDELRNRSVHSLAAGQYAHSFPAVAESGWLCCGQRGNV